MDSLVHKKTAEEILEEIRLSFASTKNVNREEGEDEETTTD